MTQEPCQTLVMRFSIIIIALLFSLPSFATINIVTIDTTRVSAIEGVLFGDVNTNTNTIYAGLTNNSNCQSQTSTSVCNSCSGNPGSACNTRAVHDTLLFRITFNSTEAGPILVTPDVVGTTTQIDYTGYTQGLQLAANQDQTIEIRWEDICTTLLSTSGCNGITLGTSASGRIRIGVDSSGDNTLDDGEFATDINFVFGDISGASTAATAASVNYCTGDSTDTGKEVAACNFIAYPGDSKIFLESVRTGCEFPTVDNSDANISAVRVFYTTDGTEPDLSTTSFSDVAVGTVSTSCSGSGTQLISLANSEVTGLTNGTTHKFAVAVVDEAQNVGFLTTGSATSLNDNTTCNTNDNTDWPNQNCQMATPNEVIGLIEDEFDCFITTATYGSPFRPKVEDFRKFRNLYLKTNVVGRKLIDFYYDNSPPIAAWIRNNPQVKPVMRAILYPFWLFAKLSLQYSLTAVLGVLLLFVGLFSLRRRAH